MYLKCNRNKVAMTELTELSLTRNEKNKIQQNNRIKFKTRESEHKYERKVCVGMS